MKRAYIFALGLVVFARFPASATIINIPDDYPTIQQGIDASTDGDTVLVQPGTYVENINFNGHNTVLGSLFLTTGDTAYIVETIIDGDSSGSVVTFENGEDSSAMIIGFTIQKGWAFWIRDSGGGISCYIADPQILYNNIIDNISANISGFGGGIYCDNSNAIIKYNTIKNNTAEFRGGGIYATESSNLLLSFNTICENNGSGIYCLRSNPTIVNNNFYDNSGGGIRCRDNSNPIIRGNIISGNSSNYSGGAIYCRDGSNPIIISNIISNNYAEDDGGGIEAYESAPTIINCAIFGNQAGDRGGGLHFLYSNQLLINNAVYGNLARYGGGLYFANGSSPTIRNTIFWADSALIESNEIFSYDSLWIDIAYSNIQGGWEGEGNIDVDPLFRDPENGDFHLMSVACGDSADSPCIDAGHPDILDSLLDCSWGLGQLRSDMGAYGGGDSVTVGIDQHDIPIPQMFSLSQNYPNPFNTMTIIRYSLPEPAEVKIEIFDILGRRVETLLAKKQHAGYHQVIWNAGERSSGMYFYRIEAGEYSDTKKMVLLK